MLTHPDMRIPEDTSEFAINTSNARFWEPPVQRYVDRVPGRQVGRARARFQHALDRLAGRRGAPHPDARRVFMYPRTPSDPAKPGRLRLLYEANPIGC